ncbi:MAG: LON peptidase substrate-binding domain-containing protein [Micromonosporaceae bacterium]
MGQMLPLFPLSTVLYPGVLLPLRVFEQRYRQLVRDLLEGPAPRRFGVIAIRKGRETGAGGISALYEIGCTAVLRHIKEHDDGRFDLVTVGTQRFRLVQVDDSLPYLRAEVNEFAEEIGDEAAGRLAVRAVQEGFRGYLDALTRVGASQVRVADLPDEPVRLSYLVAASLIVDLPHKQALLAEPDAVGRLDAERALLSRETSMLSTLTSAPAPGLRYSPYGPN